MDRSVLWHVPCKETQHCKDNSEWGFEESNTKKEQWKQQRVSRGMIKTKRIYERIQHISGVIQATYIHIL